MLKLTCHCGSFGAEINASINELAKIVKCNCSICKRKNATMGMVKNEDFKITSGEDKLSLYQYHTKVANHYFCKECGIYTHHNPRSAPAMTYEGRDLNATIDARSVYASAMSTVFDLDFKDIQKDVFWGENLQNLSDFVS